MSKKSQSPGEGEGGLKVKIAKGIWANARKKEERMRKAVFITFFFLKMKQKRSPPISSLRRMPQSYVTITQRRK